MKFFVSLFTIFIMLGANDAHAIQSANCSPSSRTMEVELESCRVVDPYSEWGLVDRADKRLDHFLRSEIRRADSSQDIAQAKAEAMRLRTATLMQYWGAMLEDKSGNRYFHPTKNIQFCQPLKGAEKLRLEVAETCCENSSEPPCWLGTRKKVSRIYKE